MTLAGFSFTDRWRPLVELGTGDSRAPQIPGRWDIDRWDNPAATWSGIEPLWNDVSCFVTSVGWSGGRSYAVDRMAPASGSIEVLNTDGWATQLADNVLDVRPGRQVRVGIIDVLTGERTSLYRGWIDAANPSYPPPSESANRVTFQMIDALGEIGLTKALPLGAPVGAGETGDARFSRCLARYNWPTQWVETIDHSAVAMQATDFSAPAVDELGLLAESEGGAIIATEDGKLVFRSRNWIVWPTGTPLDGSIGNSTGEVCPAEWTVTRSRADGTIVNRAIMGRAGGAPIQLDDTTSQARYGPLPFERSDLICSADADVKVLGQRVIRTRASGKARVAACRLTAKRSNAAQVIPLALGARLWSSPPARYRCHHVEPYGTEFDTVQLLSQLGHEITRDRWDITLGFTNAEPFTSPAARWDSALWDVDPWSVSV